MYKRQVHHTYLRDAKTFEIITAQKYDIAVDCIDTLSTKGVIIKHCFDNNLKVGSSLGVGGKFDPTKIEITDVSKSHNCDLAKYVRKRLNRLGIRKGFKVVFSAEDIDDSKVIELDDDGPKKSIIGTISYMPAVFGCAVAVSYTQLDVYKRQL